MHRRVLTACPILVSFAVSLPLLAGTTTVVVDGGSDDWGFLPEGGSPSGYFTVGPDAPPAGAGSAFLQTNEKADGIALISQELIGTRLDEITSLGYWTRTTSPPQAPALQFSVDYDSTDGDTDWQGRLVFEPSESGTVEADVWQEWSTLDGNWWATGAPGSGPCHQTTPCSWAEVLEEFPDAAIRGPLLGQFLVKSGSGWTGTIGTWVDAIAVTTVGGLDVLVDFESTSTRIHTTRLGENGWFSDDTRADGTAPKPAPTGEDLVSPTLTDDPEGSSGDATADHDDDILNQIEFELFGPPVAPPADQWQGAVHLTIDASSGTAGKSQISHRNDPSVTGDGDGFGYGHEVLTELFQVRYSWRADNLGNPGITGALKLGFVTTDHPGPDMSDRTGEDSWDKLLVYEPSNGNGGSADGFWQTEHANFSSGDWWIVDRAGGISTTQSNPMTLEEMTTSMVTIGGRTVAELFDLLTDEDPGEEAVLTSIQFGIGSNNPGGSVWINEIETSFYRKGMITSFGQDPAESTVVCVPSAFDAACEAVATTIQDALDLENLGAEDVVLVDSGVHAEAPTVTSPVVLRGAGAGATACGDPEQETVVTGTLTISAPDVVVDGLSLAGSGPRVVVDPSADRLNLRNNRLSSDTASLVELREPSEDVTIEQNAFAGDAPARGGGGQILLSADQPGLYVVRNCFSDSTVPAVHLNDATVEPSSTRAPAIVENDFVATAGGIDASAGTVRDVEISGNRFLSQTAAGVRGRLVDTIILDNLFDTGTRGVSIEPSSDGDATGTSVFLNCFTNLSGAAVEMSNAQTPGTIATNDARFNDFVGNGAGASYAGDEAVDVTSNYWGAPDGPEGSGDPIDGAALVFEPFAASPNTISTPCNPAADLRVTKTDDVPDLVNAVVGGPVTYTISVENLGPFDATNAQVIDPIPGGLGSCSWTCSGSGGGSCAGSGDGSITETVDLPVGGSVTFELTCLYAPGPGEYAVTNTAFVLAGDQADLFPGNDSDSERTSNDVIFADGFETGDTAAWSP